MDTHPQPAAGADFGFRFAESALPLSQGKRARARKSIVISIEFQ